MAIFFLDFEGGDDTKDGTSFANRWRSITNGATAARIAPGDIIRIMGSPDPTSIGNATWTDLGTTITVPAGLNQDIETCDSAWVASANVTTGTTSNRKEGTLASTFIIGASFTTGLIAYKAMSATDFSAFQQISLWWRSGAPLPTAGQYELRLCSDALGVTAVNSIALPEIKTAGVFMPVCVDTGGALGASIQSVALYRVSGTGAPTITIDNIIACKAPASADSISLKSLLGKNTADETWWPIRSIRGTTITFDQGPDSLASTAPLGYSGTSETVTTYKRECIDMSLLTTPRQDIQDSGTAGNNITFSFGWDRTNMTTQNLQTWMDWKLGNTGNSYGLYQSTSKNYITFAGGFGCVRAYYAFLIIGTNFNITGEVHCVGSSASGFFTSSFSGLNVSGTIYSVCNASYGADLQSLDAKGIINSIVSKSNGIGGVITGTTSDNIQFTSLICNNHRQSNGFGYRIGNTSRFVHISSLTANDNINGIDILYGVGLKIDSCTLLRCTSYAAKIDISQGVIIKNLTATTTNAAQSTMQILQSDVTIYTGSTVGTSGIATFSVASQEAGRSSIRAFNFTVAEANVISGVDSNNNTIYASPKVSISKYGGVANDHRIFTDGGGIKSETGIRDTPSGIAWRMSVTSTTRDQYYPLVLPIATVAVNANKLVTASIRMYRSSATTLVGALVCRGGQIGGVSNDVSSTTAGAAGAFETVSITFTPNEAGVVELEVWAYDGTGTTDYLVIDNITVTQAA